MLFVLSLTLSEASSLQQAQVSDALGHDSRGTGFLRRTGRVQDSRSRQCEVGGQEVTRRVEAPLKKEGTIKEKLVLSPDSWDGG